MCTVKTPDDSCCAKRTLTFDKPNRVPPNSNLSGHIRDEAKRCPYHAEALGQLAEQSKNQVLMPGGGYETVHSFDEAFPHHIDYVMMVATGEVSGNTGQKPMFRTYVRGAPAIRSNHVAVGSKSTPTAGMLCRRARAACRLSTPRYPAPHRRVYRRAAGRGAD
eukprot:346876-Prymnesium_polylepis.2